MTDFTHIRELLAKATPGPWEWRTDQFQPHVEHQWTISPGVLAADYSNGTPGGDEIDRANAALITALRNNAEAMLDRIEKLEAVAEAARICVKGHVSVIRQADAEHDVRKALKALDSEAS
jgi:hypothetical protein